MPGSCYSKVAGRHFYRTHLNGWKYSVRIFRERAKSKSNSQIYIVNFFTSGRVVINAKDFRIELRQIHISRLEKLCDKTFDIKGATQLIQTTSESEPGHPNNNQQNIIRNGQDTYNIRMGKILRSGATSKIILLKKIKLQTANNKQRISYFRRTHAIGTVTTKRQQKTDNGLSEIPTNINVSPKHEDFKRNCYSSVQITEGL